MLTLDSTLAAAQNSQSRHPLVEIVSSQSIADIPFDGTFLTNETFNEFGPNVIAHSSGRLAAAYCYGPDADSDCGIKYIVTDVARQEFTTVTIELFTASTYVMKGVSLCELTNGNICLTYLYTFNGRYYLASRIITVAGVLVAGSVKAIGDWATSVYTSDPWIQTIGTNSYLMVYGKQNGANYYIYKRTSADCLTWSADGALSIAGLTSTWRLSNPSILKISTGDLWLWFDVLEASSPSGDPLTNVYYSISTDSGATWAAAVKITNYTNYSMIGANPVAAQKTAGQMHVMFNQIMGALHADENMAGWPTGDASNELSWDSVNRKLYVVNSRMQINSAYRGYYLQCIVRIDVDTWTVDKFWDGTTTPAIPVKYLAPAGSMATGHLPATARNDGHHIAFSYGYIGLGVAPLYVMYLDGEADTITDYDLSAGGNVTGLSAGASAYIMFSFMDATANRLWLMIRDTNSSVKVHIGYLDLTEVSDYKWHPVVVSPSDFINYSYVNSIAANGGLCVDTDNGYIIVTGGTVIGGTYGICIVFDIITGALIKRWNWAEASTALGAPMVYNGKIYAMRVVYTNPYANASLVEFDVDADSYEIIVPPYLDGSYYKEDGYYYAVMSRPCYLQGDKIAMIHQAYGIAIFDTVLRTWDRFSNDTISGFTLDGIDPHYKSQLVFDATNEMIMFGDYLPSYTYSKGVVMFNINGYIKQTYYSVGTYSGGLWSFAAAAVMMLGYADYDAAAVVEPGSTSSMFVFWTNRDIDNLLSIKWDKDGSSMDISPYIAGEVVERKSIDGSRASLTFPVSHGHLFDPYNVSSVLNNIFKKGRTLTLRWGEKISGTDYWQASGVYYVTEASMSFRRGQYPIMTVKAEDRRCLWAHGHVYATAIYNGTAKTIIDYILTVFGGLAAGDINTPVMGTGLIEQQWMETTIDEIINQICDRRGYYFRFDYQGKAHARPITNAAAIDHTYADNTKLLEYTPDDSYSDFTNRVTVRGQELDFTEVTYAEERITSLSGTLGWWGCKADHHVFFSEDRSRRAIDPRLVIIETSTSIAMQLAGSVEERLVECGAGADNKFCTVFIEAPDLTPLLIQKISALIAACFIPDPVWTGGFVASAGSTICVGSAVRTFIMAIISMILGSVANYQMEVWAKPLGQIRQSIQGQANDTAHQTEINAIIEQVIDDPLCYSHADCLEVASFELMVAQMQRRRVKYSKIAHLQDEDGDTIRVVHPYSGQNIDMFISDLTRRFKKSTSDDDDGYFIDDIEGWVIP